MPPAALRYFASNSKSARIISLTTYVSSSKIARISRNESGTSEAIKIASNNVDNSKSVITCSFILLMLYEILLIFDRYNCNSSIILQQESHLRRAAFDQITQKQHDESHSKDSP